MKLLIDADACPVTALTERVAREFEIPVFIFCDTSHVISSDYATVITVGQGADAVDFTLLGRCAPGDLVVTQDYGVAAMVLGKGAAAIHQRGIEYTNDNIDQLLLERHNAKKTRRANGNFHGKGPKKRTGEDDLRFEQELRRIIERLDKK